MQVKVSLISPCYNGETHLLPYIEGLLSQTYTNVEYIFVNDGSDDKTEEIINSYIDKFRDKGWDFKYIKQEKRQGQAAAINQALKIFTGEYFCCIDSDDVLMPTYIEKMVEFLESNKDCAIAFPWAETVEEKTNKHIEFYKRYIPENIQDTLFDDFILQKYNEETHVLYASFMMKSEPFLKIYPNRNLYEGLSGQNAQLILPVLYNYKAGYVKEILYKCVARQNSDSRKTTTQDYINKTYSWEDIYCQVLKTIPNMPDYEKAYYFAEIKKHWEQQRQNCKPQEIKLIDIEKPSQNKVKFTDYIFSVKNEYSKNKKHKVLRILGMQIKFKCK